MKYHGNTHTNKRILTDGGVQVASGNQQALGQTKLDSPGGLQQSAGAGGGYDMFEAQADYVRSAEQLGEEHPQTKALANNVKAFRANAFFGDHEWRTLDAAAVEAFDDDARIFNDLRNRGLTTNTDLSSVIYEYEKVAADVYGEAAISMGLEDRSQDEVAAFTEQYDGIPIPIVHKSYHLNRRTLNVGARAGRDINTELVEVATRGVTETIDDMFLNGWNTNVEGYSVPGLRNYTNRLTHTANNWGDTVNTTASEIRGDILSGVETLEDNGYDQQNYVFYVSRTEMQELRRREVGSDNQRQLITKLEEELDYVDFVRTTSLPAGEAILMHPTSDVLEMVVASDLQNVEWESHAGFTTHMKVMASITPLIKSTTDNVTGYVHYTGLQG